MMRSEKGLALHEQAEHTRETGQFEESIKLAQRAIEQYEADGDFLGQSDAYGSLALSFRHLGMLDEAKDAALEGIKIAEDHDLGGDRARPYFNLAKVLEEKSDLTEAVESYKKSVEIFKTQNPRLHNRSGVLADMKIHLATCEYKNGDKSALDRVLTAISDLENSEEVKYNKDVWLSGAHMKVADMLRIDDIETAKSHFNIAKQIIDANPELTLRKGQWEKLAKNFS